MFANLTDGKIRYSVLGDGEPLVFLHGGFDSLDDWESIAASLCDDYRCILIDLPGFGLSQASDAFTGEFALLDRVIVELLVYLGIDGSVSLVAHDIGGLFAASFLTNHRNRVARLVMLNQPFFSAAFKPSQLQQWWGQPFIGGYLTKGFMSWPIFKRALKRHNLELSASQIRMKHDCLGPDTSKALAKLYRHVDFKQFDVQQNRMASLLKGVPTLVIWGASDPYINDEVCYSFQSAQHVVLSGAGHWPHLTATHAVLEAIREFAVSPMEAVC